VNGYTAKVSLNAESVIVNTSWLGHACHLKGFMYYEIWWIYSLLNALQGYKLNYRIT